MNSPETIILQTKNWITQVVIGCNFCPFAAKEMKNGTVHYKVEFSTDLNIILQSLMRQCDLLDKDETVETSFLILPEAVQKFNDYLHLVSLAEKLLKKTKYEGIYQIASFHPQYTFAGSPTNDAANYTNRSVYPMLHLLREESIEKVLKRYPDPEGIPERNINFARNKGEAYMKMLRDSCM